MKWFQGNINEAVAASKTKKAIFVVFVEGKDHASSEIAKVIDSQEISSRLQRDDFVAVKLEGGSESYGFFAQIYQLVPIPSLFFIGQNGAPLEVIAGETSIADLTSKIDTILTKVGPSSKDSSTSLIQSEQRESSGSSSLKNSESELSTIDLDAGKSESNMAPALAPTTSKEDKDEKEVKIITQGKSLPAKTIETETKTPPQKLDTPLASSAGTEALKAELTPEEKLERARQLIELQKRQREEEEAKKIREREIQRRKTGQEMVRIKQQQQELEIKQAYEERMKEKAAEAAAREKVRRQIAQDKLERKQRELDSQKQQKTPEQEQLKPRTPMSSDSRIARIQFRLPSGTPHTGQFDSTSTLGVLRSYVIKNIELPFRQFALSTSFPRRELTVQDDDKTLLELELVPTSVILILPLKNASATSAVTSAQGDGYLSRFMWAIYASIISVYGYVTGYFTGRPRSAEQQNSGSPSGEAESTTSNTDRPISRLVQGAGLPSGRNLGGQGSTSIRAQGNVHRLHSGRDRDNDENNTWNGNSTQQM